MWNLIRKLWRLPNVSWSDHVALEMRVASMYLNQVQKFAKTNADFEMQRHHWWL